MTNQKQMKLIIENWRGYIAESDVLDEGLKEKVISFLKNKLEKAIDEADKIVKPLQQEKIDLNALFAAQPEMKKITQDYKKLGDALKQGQQELKENIRDIFSSKEFLLEFSKHIEEKSVLAEEHKKELEEEVTVLAALGISLGVLGLGVWFCKAVMLALDALRVDKSGKVYTFFKKLLAAVETVEEGVRRFFRPLTSTAAYPFTLVALKMARANPNGFFGKRFKKAGLKLLLDERVPLPPFEVFAGFGKDGKAFRDSLISLQSYKEFFQKTVKHIEHTGKEREASAKNNDEKYAAAQKANQTKAATPGEKGLANLEELLDKKTISLIENLVLQELEDLENTKKSYGDFAAIMGGAEDLSIDKMSAKIQEEIKLIVKINRDIGYYLMLIVLAITGIWTITSDGFHGVITYLEGIASGVKVGEAGAAVKGAVG